MNEIDTLKHFLGYPIWDSKPVFDKFRTIDGAIFREKDKEGKERFLFIEGKNKIKVVLVAHADTFLDQFYGYSPQEHFVETQGDYFFGRTSTGERVAFGADDRAGCAMLWTLRDSGNSILVVDGEERGRIGSKWLIRENPDIARIINEKHQFMIQFDRRNNSDFKCYDVGTDKFRAFIKERTNFTEPEENKKFYSDICTLCVDICGVNFSIGYYDEHKASERINFNEWLNTLRIIKGLLNEHLPRFER